MDIIIKFLFYLAFASPALLQNTPITINTNECGLSKGCWQLKLGILDTCTSDTCDVVITFKMVTAGSKQLIEFEMSGPWQPDAVKPSINLGISDDDVMGSDYTLTCYYDGAKVVVSSGNTLALPRHFHEFAKNNSGLIGISDFQGYYDSEKRRLTCKFKHVSGRVDNPNVDFIKDLSPGKKYYLLVATAANIRPDVSGISYHGRNYRAVLATIVSFDETVSYGGASLGPKLLVKLHGCFMLGAWIIFVCIGIVTSRHYRLTVPFTRRTLGERLWLQIHRVLLLCALVLTVAAFIMIFISVGGYASLEGIHAAHPILGIILTALILLNATGGMFRPSETSRIRPFFKWGHFAMGTLAQIISVPTLLLGMSIDGLQMPEWTFWLLVGFICFHLVFELVLQMHAFYIQYRARAIREAKQAQSQSEENANSYQEQDTANANGQTPVNSISNQVFPKRSTPKAPSLTRDPWRLVALAIYVPIPVAVAGVLIYFLATR